MESKIFLLLFCVSEACFVRWKFINKKNIKGIYRDYLVESSASPISKTFSERMESFASRRSKKVVKRRLKGEERINRWIGWMENARSRDTRVGACRCTGNAYEF